MTFRHFLWVAFAALNSGSTRAEAPTLRIDMPVICTMQADCLIQKLVDVDVSPKRVDYRCGTLATDGHDGIDIRVRTLADMRKGVAVTAAASGRVLRVRDGEPDMNVRDRGNLNGRDAGNAVVIDHGNGWETQYSHLRNGTVLVRPGQTVSAGERIGSIGMSGNAEFPHLHFAVRHNSQVIDPFTGLTPPSHCVSAAKANSGALWSRNAAQALSYQPTAIIAVGFGIAPPSSSVVDRDRSAVPRNPLDPLVFWADVLGAMPGDTQRFEIRDRNGAMLFERISKVERGGLSWLAYAGRKAPAGGWPKGTMTGRYELTRSGTIVDTRAARLTIG
jgi:hypothetical protein